MLKKIKRWGNNLVVVFTKEDEESYGIKEGDTLDLGDMIIQPKPRYKRIPTNNDRVELFKKINKRIKGVKK